MATNAWLALLDVIPLIAFAIVTLVPLVPVSVIVSLSYLVSDDTP